MIGETIGNFYVVSLLGRGGMGEVYLAQHTTIGTKVALKVLLPEVSSDTVQVQRFFNEARAVSVIKHAGIVKIFDVGFHTSGRAYLIMEALEGESLGERLRRAHRLHLAELIDIGRQIASVLHATHTAGITHRDLKPDNIFVSPDEELPSQERVKVLDFGIAKLGGMISGKVPRTIGTMGTPTYMAPEQWGDSGAVDWRADAYSLGCVLYEMATGQPPFDGDTFAALYTKHLTQQPASIRVFDSDLPVALDNLLQRLLAKAPSDRPNSMLEIVRTFDAMRPPGQQLGPYDRTIHRDPAASRSGPVAKISDRVLSDTSNTTLSRASHAGLTPQPSRRVIGGLVASIMVVTGACIWYAVSRRSSKDEPVVEAPPVSVTPIVSPPVDSPIDAPALSEVIAAANPWTAVHGMRVQAHQVTRGEYQQFLASQPTDLRPALIPLGDWSDPPPVGPVNWVTFDHAQRFCEAVGARLATSEEWGKLSEGSWGLDPANRGVRGPLREWTSTVEDGLGKIRGAQEKMTAAQKKREAHEPQLMAVELQVGGDITRDTIASSTLGFRCTAQ